MVKMLSQPDVMFLAAESKSEQLLNLLRGVIFSFSSSLAEHTTDFQLSNWMPIDLYLDSSHLFCVCTDVLI